MKYLHEYKVWKEDPFFEPDTHMELRAITNEEDIKERFEQELIFNADGIKALMGVGTNRINKYTVARLTTGVGNYLNNLYGKDVCQVRGVVIGYDTRNNGSYLAKIVAEVLSGLGIKAYLYAHARPLPQVVFSVKLWNAVAGIVLSAGTLPTEYNGYKVYDENGQMLSLEAEQQVKNCIDAISDYRTINFESNYSLITMGDVTDNFIQSVLKCSILKDKEPKEKLKILYTPLHGTGYIPIWKILRLAGFTQINVVEEQARQDGNFTTVMMPNPEDERAFDLAISYARRKNADIILGTDPGCEKVGLLVKSGDGYSYIGNDKIEKLLTVFTPANEAGTVEMKRINAVVKVLLIAEMAAYYEAKNKTLADVLNDIN